MRATRARFWLLVPQAILGIAIGVLAIAQQPPDNYKGGLMFVYDVGIWAIPRGILELVAAIRLRNEMTGGFWLGLAGVLSVVFGVLLFIVPGSGRWIGRYAFMLGMMLLVFALRLRAFARANGGGGAPVPLADH